VICLDTNAVIAAMNPRRGLRDKLERALARSIAVGIPAVVLFELWYGIAKSTRPETNAAGLARFLALPILLWPFDAEDAREAGDVRATLERAGTPIGPYDVLIAAQARRRDATLVTANAREFARVPGLRCEDWAAPG
jgi:tRNA(fMet)-specific endonuclease VapC